MGPEILIVGDRSHRGALVPRVQDLGYTVTPVRERELSSRVAANPAPAAVLVCLGEADAAGLVAAIRRGRDDVPVVLYGQLGGELRDLADVLELGADNFLAAPVSDEELARVLAELVGPGAPDDDGSVREDDEFVRPLTGEAGRDPVLGQLHRTLEILAARLKAHESADSEPDALDLESLGLDAVPDVDRELAPPDAEVLLTDPESSDPAAPRRHEPTQRISHPPRSEGSMHGDDTLRLRGPVPEDRSGEVADEGSERSSGHVRGDRPGRVEATTRLPGREPERRTGPGDTTARLLAPRERVGDTTARLPGDRREAAVGRARPGEARVERAETRRAEVASYAGETQRLRGLEERGRGAGREFAERRNEGREFAERRNEGREFAERRNEGREFAERRNEGRGAEREEAREFGGRRGEEGREFGGRRGEDERGAVGAGRELDRREGEARGIAARRGAEQDGIAARRGEERESGARRGERDAGREVGGRREEFGGRRGGEGGGLGRRDVNESTARLRPEPARRARVDLADAELLAGVEIVERLWQLHARQATGRLVVGFGDGTIKQVWWRRGEPIYAASTASADGLLARLQARGLLARAQVGAASRVVDEELAGSARRLVQAGLLKPREQQEAVRDAVRRIAESLCSDGAGRWRFDGEPAPAEVAPGGPMLALLAAGVRLGFALERLREALPEDTGLRVEVDDVQALALELDWPEADGWLGLLDGSRSLAQLVAEDGLDERELWTAGCVLLAAGLAVSVEPDADAVLVAIDRRRIDERLALARDSDYFALLGVGRAAGRAEVLRAHADLRDTFADERLEPRTREELADALAELHAALDEAREVLLDEVLRTAYLAQLPETGDT